MNTPVSASDLRDYIAAESDQLLAVLRMYVVRAGLASFAEAAPIAEELLNDVVIEALEHSDRFTPGRAPLNWLLGIAANLIKRRRAARARRMQREPLARDLLAHEVDSGKHLGNGMLHLEAGVNFHEIAVIVCDEKLDGSQSGVSEFFEEGECCVSHRFADFLRQSR